MSKSNVALLQGAIVGRRVRSQRELDILALERRLEVVKDALEHHPGLLLRIVPERGDDWDGGLVGDLVRAARAVAGNGLLLDRYDRELLACRPWYSRYPDYPEDGWDGLSPDTREIYNAMSTGTLGDPQLGRVVARIHFLIAAAEKLLALVAPIERPKPKRARRTSTEAAPHAGQ